MVGEVDPLTVISTGTFLDESMGSTASSYCEGIDGTSGTDSLMPWLLFSSSLVEGVDGDRPLRKRCLNDLGSSGGGDVLAEDTLTVGVGSYFGKAISSPPSLLLLNLKNDLSRWGKVTLGVLGVLSSRVRAAEADVDRFRLNTSSMVCVCVWFCVCGLCSEMCSGAVLGSYEALVWLSIVVCMLGSVIFSSCWRLWRRFNPFAAFCVPSNV